MKKKTDQGKAHWKKRRFVSDPIPRSSDTRQRGRDGVPENAPQ